MKNGFSRLSYKMVFERGLLTLQFNASLFSTSTVHGYFLVPQREAVLS